jgi:peptide/nickel transport system permease protein
MAQTALQLPKSLPDSTAQQSNTQKTPGPTRDNKGGGNSVGARNRKRRGSIKRISLIISAAFFALVLIAAFAPNLLASGDPSAGDTAQILQAPGAAHWFGTDHLGRDLYTRVVHGTALSLRTALIAVTIALISGAIFGLMAGFLGGWIDQAVMRVVDVLLAIPSLLLSLALISALGFGSTNVAIAVAIGSVATFARIARSQSLRVRQTDYVGAARSMGSRWYITLFRHVLPNSVGPIVALAVLEFGMAILAVSALSFLGYGAPRPAPEWGSLVSEGRNYLGVAWWITTLPGLVIAATVLAVNRLARSVGTSGGN